MTCYVLINALLCCLFTIRNDSFTPAEQFTGVSIFDKSGNLIF